MRITYCKCGSQDHQYTNHPKCQLNKVNNNYFL